MKKLITAVVALYLVWTVGSVIYDNPTVFTCEVNRSVSVLGADGKSIIIESNQCPGNEPECLMEQQKLAEEAGSSLRSVVAEHQNDSIFERINTRIRSAVISVIQSRC